MVLRFKSRSIGVRLGGSATDSVVWHCGLADAVIQNVRRLVAHSSAENPMIALYHLYHQLRELVDVVELLVSVSVSVSVSVLLSKRAFPSSASSMSANALPSSSCFLNLFMIFSLFLSLLGHLWLGIQAGAECMAYVSGIEDRKGTFAERSVDLHLQHISSRQRWV